MQSTKELCSTAEAAKLLDVSRPYLTKLIRDGRIEAIRMSDRVYILDKRSVLDYLKFHRDFSMGGPRKDGSDRRSREQSPKGRAG